MRLIIIMFVCGWFSCVFANEPAGTVTFVEGVADLLTAGGQTVTLREGQTITIKDRIRTKSYSKASIALADKSVLKLAPSSCISVEELSMGPSGARQRCVVVLSRGKAEAVVAKTGAPETFIIRTPNAQGSVKGSDIFVSYLAGKTGMFVKQGAMSVINPEFPQDRRMLTQGECVTVPLEGPPEQARQSMKIEMTMHKRDVEPEMKRKWVPSEDATVMNAVVTSVAGTVRAYKKSGQDWVALVSGDVMEEGDKLQTGADGKAEIRLGNGNSISVEPSTEIAFLSLRYDAQSGNYHNEFEVSEGEVLAVVEKISGESTFQVRTPTAVSGVRGTIMRVVVDPLQPGMPAPQTQIFFEGGRGDVKSLASGAMQQLLPGENVRVDPQGAILQPMATSPKERTMMMQVVSEKQMVGQITDPKGAQREGFIPLPMLPDQKEGLPLPPPPPPGSDMLLPPLPPPNINPDIWYRAPLQIYNAPAAINSAVGDYRELTLKSNGTWNAIFNGAYSANVTPGWSIQLNNAAGDFVDINNIPAGLPMTPPPDIVKWVGLPGGFAGAANGPEVNRVFTLTEVIVEADTTSHHLVVDARGTYQPI